MMQQKTYSCFQCGSRALLRSRNWNLRRKGCNGQNKAHYINQSAGRNQGNRWYVSYVKRTTSSPLHPCHGIVSNRHSSPHQLNTVLAICHCEHLHLRFDIIEPQILVVQDGNLSKFGTIWSYNKRRLCHAKGFHKRPDFGGKTLGKSCKDLPPKPLGMAKFSREQ